MLDPPTRAALAGLSSALIGDARVRSNLPETHLEPGIRPVTPSTAMVGTALTAELKVAPTPADADLLPLVELYESQPSTSGAVIVIQVPVELHGYGIFGEGAATMTRRHGFVGALIDGATRDGEVLRQMQYPVFARHCTPGYMPLKASVASIGAPVTIGGRTIRQGDVIIGDHDGVIVVRPEELDKVLAKANAIKKWEDQLHAYFADGTPYKVAIEKIGPLP